MAISLGLASSVFGLLYIFSPLFNNMSGDEFMPALIKFLAILVVSAFVADFLGNHLPLSAKEIRHAQHLAKGREEFDEAERVTAAALVDAVKALEVRFAEQRMIANAPQIAAVSAAWLVFAGSPAGDIAAVHEAFLALPRHADTLLVDWTQNQVVLLSDPESLLRYLQQHSTSEGAPADGHDGA